MEACHYVNMVIQLLISSEHWQTKPVSAIHHVKNRKYQHKHLLCLESHSNTKTKNQSSTLSNPRHLAACSGYMEQSCNGSWPRPVFHLDPIYHFLPMHFLCGYTGTSSTLFSVPKGSLKAEYSTHFEAFESVVLITSCH